MEEELSHVSHAQLSFIFVEILHKHLKQQHKKKKHDKKTTTTNSKRNAENVIIEL